jgi:hypothetical protein
LTEILNRVFRIIVLQREYTEHLQRGRIAGAQPQNLEIAIARFQRTALLMERKSLLKNQWRLLEWFHLRRFSGFQASCAM